MIHAKRREWLVGAAWLLGGSIPLIPASAFAQSQPVTSLEEVLVTASRRATTVRETPVSVTALGQGDVDEKRLVNAQSLTTVVPNLQFGSGASQETRLTIRGVGNTASTIGSNSGVTFHVNGVPLERSFSSNGTFYDVARIEVLRGPQGTLFGRNATGGLVNVIPRKPTEEFSASVAGTVGLDPTEYRLEGFVNGQIAEGVYGRLSVLRNYNEGYTDNLFRGPPYTFDPYIAALKPIYAERFTKGGVPRRLDNADGISARAQVRFVPSDRLDATAMVEYQRDEAAGPANYFRGTPSPNLSPIVRAGGILGDLEKHEVYANFGDAERELIGGTLDVSYDIGPGSFRLLLAQYHTDYFYLYDGDGTQLLFSKTAFDQSADQTYAELVYSSPAGRSVEWIVGANYLREEAFQDVIVHASTVITPQFPQGTLTNIIGDLETESYAAFLHATWHLNEDLRAFGGVRYTWEEKTLSEYNNRLPAALQFVTQTKSWDRATFELGVSYDLRDNITGYVKYSTGFKSGGFSSGSAAQPFDEETNANLEAGLKGTYFDGALQANLTAFTTDYDDLQVSQIILVTPVISNAVSSKIKGFEVEAIAHLSEALRVEFVGSLLDATFKDFMTRDSARPLLGVLQLKGNRLPRAPKSMFSLGAYYKIPVWAGAVTLGARYYWQDTVYFSEFNLPVVGQAAAGRGDLTLDYRSDDGAWSAGLFATNITNEGVFNHTLVGSANTGSTAAGFAEPGRRVGLTVRRNF